MNTNTMTRTDQAQLAMMLEVTAFPKPGNIDRCHDYPSTRLEHFLASTIFSHRIFERAEKRDESVGVLIRDAIAATSVHRGGNTHFGAFILLIPLIMGGDIPGALDIIRATTIDDAIAFYEAFKLTKVKMEQTDELDVDDPKSPELIRHRRLTLLHIMEHSAPRDMITREWINGYNLTRRGADLLKLHGCGREAIVATFLDLLATEVDTFIVKEHGEEVAREVMQHAQEVQSGLQSLAAFDETCVVRGINPGSLADILIASLYVALGEGWVWDC